MIQNPHQARFKVPYTGFLALPENIPYNLPDSKIEMIFLFVFLCVDHLKMFFARPCF